MKGWRVALRIAWREARRAKGRMVLVLAMIAVPVAALAFAAASYDTFTLTSDEHADRIMGTGQAVGTWPYDTPVQQRPDQLQPFTAVPPHKIDHATTEALLARRSLASRPEAAFAEPVRGDRRPRLTAGRGSRIGRLRRGADRVHHSYANQWPSPAPYPITVPWLNVGVALVLVPAADRTPQIAHTQHRGATCVRVSAIL